MEIESIKPFLAVAVTFLGAIVVALTPRWPNIRDGSSLVTAALMLVITLSMIPAVLDGNTLRYTLWSLSIPSSLSIAFRVDAMGLLFAVHAALMWIVIAPYSIGYMRTLNEQAQTRYSLCIALVMAATMGVSFADNLLTLYIFYEAASLFVYPMVVHYGNNDAWAKGNTYVFYVFAVGKFYLLACLLAYGLSGTLDFSPQGFFPPDVDATLLIVAFILFLVGITKAVIVPFHAWLPPAMFGPVPTITIHHVGGVGVGAFVVLRTAYFMFGADTLKELNLGLPLMVAASITIVVASVIAMTKDDLKARLIYSTIGQISYTLFGAALLAPAGLTGGLLQIVTHAFGKTTLFFCVGAIIVASGKTKVSELNGIGRKMPFTMAAFAIGAFSVIGFPPFTGFTSKWYLFLGAAEAEQYYAVGVLAVSSILSAFYLLPIVYAAFFKDLPPGENGERREAPAIMLVPLLLTAVGTMLLFFVPSLFIDLADIVMGEVG
jgi:multicomponent Na+:H+ antiporter subunit D